MTSCDPTTLSLSPYLYTYRQASMHARDTCSSKKRENMWGGLLYMTIYATLHLHLMKHETRQ